MGQFCLTSSSRVAAGLFSWAAVTLCFSLGLSEPFLLLLLLPQLQPRLLKDALILGTLQGHADFGTLQGRTDFGDIAGTL